MLLWFRAQRSGKPFKLHLPDFCQEAEWRGSGGSSGGGGGGGGGGGAGRRMVPPAQAANARADCLYGLAKAAYDPRRHRLRDLCSAVDPARRKVPRPRAAPSRPPPPPVGLLV